MYCHDTLGYCKLSQHEETGFPTNHSWFFFKTVEPHPLTSESLRKDIEVDAF